MMTRILKFVISISCFYNFSNAFIPTEPSVIGVSTCFLEKSKITGAKSKSFSLHALPSKSALEKCIQQAKWRPPPGIHFAGVRTRNHNNHSSKQSSSSRNSNSRNSNSSGNNRKQSNTGDTSGTSTSLPVVGGAVMPDGGLSPCIIKVIGVGGGGSNAVDRMMDTRVGGVEFWCVNTDAQALGRSKARGAKVLNIGSAVTRGLGAGGSPQVGQDAAEESRNDIAAMLKGSDLVFVTSGMGGGTGSGAAPVVAEVAKEAGALTIGIVTKPFDFEGRRRMKQATDAIDRLKDNVDTVIVVSNNKLLQIIPDDTPIERAFAVADDILRQGVVGIADIIIKPGMVNVDFADVRTVMNNAGTALMGIGVGSGKTRAEDAAAAAISSPLLDTTIDHATGVVFNLSGPADMSLSEVSRAAKMIYDNVEADANVIFGALIDESMGETVSMTVLATGFSNEDAFKTPSLSTLSDVSTDEKKKSSKKKKSVTPEPIIASANDNAKVSNIETIRQETDIVSSPPPSDDVPDFLKGLKRNR